MRYKPTKKDHHLHGCITGRINQYNIWIFKQHYVENNIDILFLYFRQELTKRYEHLILIDIDQSTKHNVDQLLWKAVFYQVIEVFRKHMNEEDDSKTRLSQILDEVRFRSVKLKYM